jgi:signal transduction histidine kinase
MRKYVLCLFCLFLLNLSYSQEENKPIKQVKEDVITIYYKSGLEFLAEGSFENALKNISLGLSVSKKTKNKSLIAFGQTYLSGYYKQKKEYYKAIENLKKALFYFVEANEVAQIYSCNFKLGQLYSTIFEFDKSLECYFTSLKIADKNKNELQIAANLEEIGGVYLLTPDLKKARINFYKAIDIYKRLNSEKGVIGNLTNLGASYQKEGTRTNNKVLVLQAIHLFEEGLEKTKKGGFEKNRSIFLGNIGSSFRFLEKYEESLAYLSRALELKVTLKRFSSAAHTCNDISETYLDMNNLSKARKYALKAIDFSKDLNIHQERFACYLLSKIEYKSGDFKKSHNYLKNYHQIQDSLFSIQKITKINDLQIQYETEKKNLTIEAQESNIALLASKNDLKNQWLLFGGLGFLALFIFILLFKAKNTVKKEKLQQEKFSQGLLQSQEEERVRIARELHDSVGQQLTLIKIKAQNSQQKEIILLTKNALEEVRSISRNLYPALLKEYGLTKSIEQLITEYEQQTDLIFFRDIDNLDLYFKEHEKLNFYRLIQECLTNIVKHAKAKSVTVNIKKEKDNVVALISDNGKGFVLDESKKKNSLGLKTIFERIKIMDGKLSIDSKINNGTTFLFSIPIKK